MAQTQVKYGPRLVGHPTGTLRAALLVRPNPEIEAVRPLQGEPSAIYRRALDQHGILVEMLKYFGVEVTVIDPPDTAPFAPAAGDLAVCFENGAALMRPSSLDRHAEVDAIEKHFAHIDVPLAGHIAAPGLLDGSDVLLAGNTAFIGITKRSNAIGRQGFAQMARANGYTPVEVKVREDVRSLRTVANAVASDTIVVAADRLDETAFAGFKLIRLERGEEFGAGVFPLGERRVVANMRFRTSLDQLRKAGIAVESIDLYDFGKVGLVPANLILALKRT
jgi:dimethylargininase